MLQYIDSAIGFAMIMLTVSLVIMVIMQAVSSLLDLRGRNLVWAMEQLFNQISPDAKKETVDRAKSTLSTWTKFFRARFAKITIAEDIAHAIANHPALTANARSLATAIRPEEIKDVLQAIKDGRGRQLFAQIDTKVQAQINVLLKPVDDMKPNIQAVNSALSAIDKLVPPENASEVKKALDAAVSATSTAAIEKVMVEVKAQAADKVDAIAKKVNQELQKATLLEQGIAKWFDTVMDHASTRFVKHNRLATFVIAVCITMFFRIDSVEIFQQIFSSPDVRARLVSAVDAAQKQADQILPRQHVGTQALKDMVDQNKLSATTKGKLGTSLPDKDTCAVGKEYLAVELSGGDDEIKDFTAICEAKQKAILASVSPDIKQLTERLDSQELRVFNLVKWPDITAPKKILPELLSEFLPHIRGLILTVILLSLGAPFWFGALKDLGSLRPSIAGKIDKENAAST